MNPEHPHGPAEISRLRRMGRALVICTALYAGAWLTAAAASYAILDDSCWTGAKTEPAPTAPTPTPTATPGPRRTAATGDPTGLTGTCAIPTTASVIRSRCSTPGALKIVGTMRLDAEGRPCKAIPFTQTVRKYGNHYLCLGSY